MAFKMHPRAKQGKFTRFLASTLTITKTGLYLNSAATAEVGVLKGYRWVIVFFDEESNPQEVGLWFWKNRQDDYKEAYYKLTFYEESKVAKISAKSFVRDYRLMERCHNLGICRFRLFLDKKSETKENFYIAKLEA